MNSKSKKEKQLGMKLGTASGRLKKSLLFKLVVQCGLDICFRCKNKIDTPEDLTVEHKLAWLDSDNPVELFFDLDNISFSHSACNSGAGKRKEAKHGTFRKYSYGCRCDECVIFKRNKQSKLRANRKLRTGYSRKYLEKT